MKTAQATMHKLLDSSLTTFTIPVYQRNYSWEEEHCKQLFNDVIELTKKQESKHFLGTLCYIVHHTGAFSEMHNEYEIIDGQQRITSVTLLLKAILDNTKDKYIIDTINSMIFGSKDKTKLKLKPIQKDEKIYTKLITDKIEFIDKASRIYKNYSYFKKRLKEENINIYEFFGAVLRLEMVAIELEKDKDNPQVVFESINSTGKKLSDFDLIRNYILMGHSEEDQKYLFENYWSKIEAYLSIEKDQKDFIWYFANIKHKLIQRPEVYSKIKALIKIDEMGKSNAEEVLKEILNYVKIYEIINSDNVERYFDFTSQQLDKLKSKIKIIKNLNIGVVYPFVMQLIDAFNLGIASFDDLIEILGYLISYLVRREITSEPTNALRSVVPNFYDALKEDGNHITKDAFLKHISNLNGYFSYPSDDRFKEGFKYYKAYEKSKSVKEILLAIEYATNKEPLQEDKLTIEHFFPQNPDEDTKDWLYTIGSEEEYLEIKDKWIHNFGNLTLSGQNSALGNKSFDEKIKMIKDNANTHLNRYFENLSTWNIEEIIKRNEDLFKDVKNIYKDIPSELRNTLNYKRDFSLLDEADFSFKKPLSLSLGETAKRVKTFKDVLKEFIKWVYEIKKEEFIDYVYQNKNNSIFKLDKPTTISCFQLPEISDVYFIDNKSGNDIMKEIRTIIKDLKIDNIYPNAAMRIKFT